MAVIALGALLLLVSVGWWAYGVALAHPRPVAVPDSVAGMPLTKKSIGREALAEVARLHGKEFPLTSGATATYGGNGEVTLWAAGAPAGPIAAEMVRAMTEKIAEGRSPFTPTGTRRMGERTVYELVGMGRRHFYFRSGSLVVWLAADELIAEEAIGETSEFYP